jgi:hypothetical protein
MSDTPEDPTDAGEPIETESAADFAPPTPEDAAPGTSTATDTVTRKGAALAMAGCLVLGGLLGWLGANAFEDDDVQPVSFQGRFPGGEGRGPGGGELRGDGRGFPGPMGPMGPGGFPGQGGPGGGFPGGPMGPDGGGWGHGEGGYDHDGGPGDDDDGADDERGTDERGDDGSDEAPTTTEGGN